MIERLSPPRPLTELEIGQVRQQLELLLKSRHFNQSRRYPMLLRYLVESSLIGETDRLKERLIGHQIFDRELSYDTNADPVVRITAAEVRKRLAQYYQETNPADVPRIKLTSGSYVVEFVLPEEFQAIEDETHFEDPHSEPVAPSALSLPSEIQPSIAANTTEVNHSSNSSLQSSTRPRRRRYVAGGFFLVTSAVLATIVFFLLSKPQTPTLSSVWGPLLKPPTPLLVSVGELSSAIARVTKGTSAQPTIGDAVGGGDYVAFSDMQSFARVSQFLDARSHPFRLQSSTVSNYGDLRQGPSVLIGAMTNQWTIRATAQLRFRFRDLGGHVWGIEDSHNPSSPAWKLDFDLPATTFQQDYAIVARFTDDSTGQPVLILAGIGGEGNIAASEFVTREEYLRLLGVDAPKGWADHNFEVVISAQVVNGISGPPKIVAKEFW